MAGLHDIFLCHSAEDGGLADAVLTSVMGMLTDQTPRSDCANIRSYRMAKDCSGRGPVSKAFLAAIPEKHLGALCEPPAFCAVNNLALPPAG